jgi:hypothetical protein
MSTERPAKGVLVFQCDVCFDTHEFSKSEGDDVSDYHACWRILHDDGWRINNGEHMCTDCAKTAKADKANPFRR